MPDNAGIKRDITALVSRLNAKPKQSLLASMASLVSMDGHDDGACGVTPRRRVGGRALLHLGSCFYLQLRQSYAQENDLAT